MIEVRKPTFSGHESFQCRHLWLKKGYDFVQQGKSFNSEEAVWDLGVGKNMVGAIRYWLRAFDLLDEQNEPTILADYMLLDEGYDPYIEDDATLWLLHYHLVKKGFATTYFLIFNELRKERIEFTEEHFIKFVQWKSETTMPFQFNPNTIKSDFEVFHKLYIGSESMKDKEDIISGILADLHLVSTLDRSGSQNFYHIEETERVDLPPEILLYTILDNEAYGLSVNFETLMTGYNSPGSIFAINRTGLLQKLENLVQKFDYLVFKDDAGVRELQFKNKPESPFDALNEYYYGN